LCAIFESKPLKPYFPLIAKYAMAKRKGISKKWSDLKRWTAGKRRARKGVDRQLVADMGIGSIERMYERMESGQLEKEEAGDWIGGRTAKAQSRYAVKLALDGTGVVDSEKRQEVHDLFERMQGRNRQLKSHGKTMNGDQESIRLGQELVKLVGSRRKAHKLIELRNRFAREADESFRIRY
jgi:hypothetical protein